MSGKSDVKEIMSVMSSGFRAQASENGQSSEPICRLNRQYIRFICRASDSLCLDITDRMCRNKGDTCHAANAQVTARCQQALREAGALHPRPERVRDEAFLNHPFFDPRDRVQVKYEMVRRHRVEGRPVTEVAAGFGVSRQAFYEAAAAFEARGIPGLVPKRPGPKRAHKCTDAVVDYVERWRAGQDVRPDEPLTAAVARRFGISIHARSLDRAVARRKKKPRR